MLSHVRPKARVAILGTGNIGTDLLMKVMRSNTLHCGLFSGRNLLSEGMLKAARLGAKLSDQGIEGIVEQADSLDMIFDATSAVAHHNHWKILQGLGKTVIDMTPAKLGSLCVPAINTKEIVEARATGATNINMVTCGGQASIPIANAIDAVHGAEIEYIEVASSISSRSAGPATRTNLDEYIETTEDALLRFTRAGQAKAILILNPAQPPIDMQTTIYAKIDNPDLTAIRESVALMIQRITAYVPGYQLIVPPTLQGGRVVTTVRVMGNGDYLPRYAGNLDIINCAAIGIAESMAGQSKDLQ